MTRHGACARAMRLALPRITVRFLPRQQDETTHTIEPFCRMPSLKLADGYINCERSVLFSKATSGSPCHPLCDGIVLVTSYSRELSRKRQSLPSSASHTSHFFHRLFGLPPQRERAMTLADLAKRRVFTRIRPVRQVNPVLRKHPLHVTGLPQTGCILRQPSSQS